MDELIVGQVDMSQPTQVCVETSSIDRAKNIVAITPVCLSDIRNLLWIKSWFSTYYGKSGIWMLAKYHFQSLDLGREIIVARHGVLPLQTERAVKGALFRCNQLDIDTVVQRSAKGRFRLPAL